MTTAEAPTLGQPTPGEEEGHAIQPEGQLGQGEQAIADAMQELPVGKSVARKIEQEDGGTVRLDKEEMPRQHVVVAREDRPDGSSREVTVMLPIDGMTGQYSSEGTSVFIRETDTDGDKKVDVHAFGDEIRDESGIEGAIDSARALKLKQEAAQSISAVAELARSEDRDNPHVAYEVAHAEKEHVETALRKEKELEAAKKAVDVANEMAEKDPEWVAAAERRRTELGEATESLAPVIEESHIRADEEASRVRGKVRRTGQTFIPHVDR